MAKQTVTLDDYRPIVGDETIDRIRALTRLYTGRGQGPLNLASSPSRIRSSPNSNSV